jgi:hypothetical protein
MPWWLPFAVIAGVGLVVLPKACGVFSRWHGWDGLHLRWRRWPRITLGWVTWHLLPRAVARGLAGVVDALEDARPPRDEP